jgi:hypothetical protein
MPSGTRNGCGGKTSDPAGFARHRFEHAGNQEEPNFEILKPSVEKVLQILFKDPPLALVNVNFPDDVPKGFIGRASRYDTMTVR